MASIHKRGKFWRAEVCRRGVRVSKTFDQKADAQEWSSNTEAEIRRGIYIDRTEAERTTLAEALERYRREVTPTKRSADREYRRIDAWLKSKLARRPLALLRGADFATYRNQRRTLGAAENTIRLELAIISHLFEVARKEWRLEGLPNPIANVTKPKGSNRRERRLCKENEEERRIREALEQCENPWMVHLFELALATAMRQGELLFLRWEHVDMKRRVARLSLTKNGDARDVPLSPKAIEVLSSLQKSVKGQIFQTSQSAVQQSWRRALQRARKDYLDERKDSGCDPDPKLLLDLRFHDLRHEATSRLFECGFNPMEVAAITGHKTLQMLKRYTHLRAEDLARRLL